MALQYDAAVSKADFTAALANNTNISSSTTAAISSVLGLDAISSLVVAGWNGTGSVVAPVGLAPDVLIINPADGANLALPTGTEITPVIVIDSKSGEDVALTIGAPAPSATARLAADASTSATAAVSATASTDTAIAKVVVGGNGNDTITYVGSANVQLDGGAGDDTLTSGKGNDVIIAGTGTNTVDAGAGNDTIVVGKGIDTVNAGTGFDTIDVAGNSTGFTATAAGNALVLTGAAGISATVTNAEFVTFADGHNLAIVGTEEEAQALSLYSVLLGRDVDAGGAANFTAQVQSGTSVAEIAQSFLTSDEHYTNLRADFLNDVYSSLLDRATDATGVATWQSQFEAGATRGDVFNAIASSDEAGNLSDADFISALYSAALGRDAEEAGLNNWVSLLASGTSRTEVADTIFASTEAVTKNNTEFVDSLFDNALGNDANELAKDFAVKALDGGSVTQADVVIAVIGQPEAQDHISNVIVVPGAV